MDDFVPGLICGTLSGIGIYVLFSSLFDILVMVIANRVSEEYRKQQIKEDE